MAGATAVKVLAVGYRSAPPESSCSGTPLASGLEMCSNSPRPLCAGQRRGLGPFIQSPQPRALEAA